MLKYLRICLAVPVLAAFVLLFCDLSEEGFFASHLSWLAGVQLIPAFLAGSLGVVVALVCLTFVYGRIYCSILCPLGLMQDLLQSFKRKKNYRYLAGQNYLRYPILVLFLLSLLLGLSFWICLLEPYSIFGRMATELGRPLAAEINNGLDFLTENQNLLRPVSPQIYGWGAFCIAALSLLVLVLLSIPFGRIYCSSICPVGTLLGFVAKHALFRIRIDIDACSHCGQCERSCKVHAICSDQARVDTDRCISCYNCLSSCKTGALSLSQERRTRSEDRRALLGLLATPLLSLSPAQAASDERGQSARSYRPRREHPLPILPAGAKEREAFSQACTGCQLCVSVCPSGILRSQDKGQNFLQPELSFETGYCRPECILCSKVCPTGAIQPLSRAQKSSLQIGRAGVKHSLCVVTRDKIPCTLCERSCPTGAIQLVGKDPLKLPAVNAEKCIGCGACEFHCPARPLAAITVEANFRQHSI